VSVRDLSQHFINAFILPAELPSSRNESFCLPRKILFSGPPGFVAQFALGAFQTFPGRNGIRRGSPDAVELEFASTALFNPFEILWTGVWIELLHLLVQKVSKNRAVLEVVLDPH